MIKHVGVKMLGVINGIKNGEREMEKRQVK